MKWIVLLIVLIGVFALAFCEAVRNYNDVVEDYSSVVDKYEDAVYYNYDLQLHIQEQEALFEELLNYSELEHNKSVSFEHKNTLLVSEIDFLEDSNAILKAKIDKLNSFSLDLNPSIFEVRTFLAIDSTDIKSYVFDSYDCTHFAHEVVRNSLSKGIFACTVEMDIGDGGHILVAFNTSERGVVYFEPQTDKEVTLRAGKKYWSDNNHAPVLYNDTIIRWTSCFEREQV